LGTSLDGPWARITLPGHVYKLALQVVKWR
jgi:hypothetical protein